MKPKLLALTLVMALLLAVFPAFAQDSTTSTVQFNGVGFGFDSSLATNVSITQYPGDATDLQQPGGPEARHTQFNLFTQQPAPESFFDAPVGVRVYRTADLAAYEGSITQVTALQDLLARRSDLAAYMTVNAENSSSNALPFLPVAPASQVIRAQAHYVYAPTINGIGYITVYRQDVSPFVNSEFWYTFQGISTDGAYYVSAIMRLTVPDFPAEIPADFNYETFTATFTDYLIESVAKLNAAASETFTPALSALDNLVQTFTFAPVGDVGVVETPVAEATSTDPTLGGLAGAVWKLASYGPIDAPIPALETPPVTAIFSEEGISGSGGCNGYSGTFQYNQGTITFGNIISTLMACEPAEITTQESTYLTALQSASTYTVGAGTLQIVYDGGVLTFTADTTPVVPTLDPGATVSDPSLGGLAGTVWTLVSYGPADAPVPAAASAPATAIFAPEGISGSAGCNGYSGPFVYNQNTITFGAMISTLMACVDQEITNQEAAYLAALPSATSFTVANGTLQIVYDGGVLTFTSAS